MPKGRIDPSLSSCDILGEVARSFGTPITGHPDYPPKHLYRGPHDGRQFRMPEFADTNGRGHLIVMTGQRMHEGHQTLELTWAFDVLQYREWFLGL
jgi:hypothetical protein